MIGETYTRTIISTLPASWLLQVAFVFLGAPAFALPVVTPVPPLLKTQSLVTRLPAQKPRATEPEKKKEQPAPAAVSARNSSTTLTTSTHHERKPASARKKAKHKTICESASQRLASGLTYKSINGKQLINVLDLDLSTANLQVVPVLAGNKFDRLEQVGQQARKVKALAAINANYFKADGTPLGALVKDGEWISGPIYRRSALGITGDGRVLVDKVSLSGTLQSSNQEAGGLTIDSLNQPRIHGSKIVVYTPRWGTSVRLPYTGVLVAVDGNGKVAEKSNRTISIPKGGFVLTDTKGSLISKLRAGDSAHVCWHVTPESWSDVVQAVSGGPLLLRDGKINIDCRSEKFPAAWSGTGIKARTVIGVTGHHHLIMATLEGKHTLQDAARLLQSLGASEALNLDGGGSTTMIVRGQTVTRNRASSRQRCVAAALAVLDQDGQSCCRQSKTTPLSSRLAAVPH
jgi:exopolysaccharide biosynthesis protein